MDVYKASFDESVDPHKYRERHVLLLISVGQTYHEGGKFAATVDLINRSGFRQCTVAVADTLQRHNRNEHLYDRAHAEAADAGDAWLNRNATALKALRLPTQVLRWDECLEDPAYFRLRDQVLFTYGRDENYRGAIDKTVARFLERLAKRDPEAKLEEARIRCLTYLIEECPIIMPSWAAKGVDYIVYPQPMTVAMAETRRVFVEPVFPDRANWLSLRFKKRKLARDDRLSQFADTIS